MATPKAVATVSRLRAFDQQQRRAADPEAPPQQELLGFTLTTPMFDTAPKVIVKKHAGAVHSRSQLSCLERKLFNVCIFIADEDLNNPNVLQHSAPISQISTLVGFDSSKNTAHLKKAFKSLLGSVVEWSIVEERGAETWEACSVLSSVRFKNGICTFEIPWVLREKLHHPERFARLDLARMRELSSVGAVALCENLVRYENLRRTPSFSIELWRALLGADAATYDDFRRLNEKVIRPAVAQINEHMPFTTEPEYIRKDRKVVSMRFSITPKDGLALEGQGGEGAGTKEDGAAPVEASALATMLKEDMLLSQSQCEQVLRDYDHDLVAKVVTYVGKRYLEGKVTTSLPAYFLGTLSRYEETAEHSALDQRRQESENAKRLQEDSAKRQQAYRESFSGVWRTRAQQVLEAMDPDQRQSVYGQFEQYLIELKSPSLRQWQGPERDTSPALAALLRNFVAERFLPDREQAFADWVKAQDAALTAAA